MRSTPTPIPFTRSQYHVPRHLGHKQIHYKTTTFVCEKKISNRAFERISYALLSKTPREFLNFNSTSCTQFKWKSLSSQPFTQRGGNVLSVAGTTAAVGHSSSPSVLLMTGECLVKALTFGTAARKLASREVDMTQHGPAPQPGISLVQHATATSLLQTAARERVDWQVALRWRRRRWRRRGGILQCLRSLSISLLALLVVERHGERSNNNYPSFTQFTQSPTPFPSSHARMNFEGITTSRTHGGPGSKLSTSGHRNPRVGRPLGSTTFPLS